MYVLSVPPIRMPSCLVLFPRDYRPTGGGGGGDGGCGESYPWTLCSISILLCTSCLRCGWNVAVRLD